MFQLLNYNRSGPGKERRSSEEKGSRNIYRAIAAASGRFVPNKTQSAVCYIPRGERISVHESPERGGARERERREEDRRRWISSVINGHDYLAKLAPLCASLFQPFPRLTLSLSFFLSLPPPTSFHLLTTSSTWGLIIPTRAFSLYTCALAV